MSKHAVIEIPPVTLLCVQLASSVVGLGVLMVIYQPGSSGSQIGVGLTVAGVACCAVYTIIARHWLGGADSTAPMTGAHRGCARRKILGSNQHGQCKGTT